jgi:hypothetical protein
MAGDEVEFIGRGMTSNRMIIGEMRDAASLDLLDVAHPNQHVRLRVAFPVEKMDLVRREKRAEP